MKLNSKPSLYLAILCSVFAFAFCTIDEDLSFSDIAIPAGVEGTGGHEAGEHGIAAADITNDGYPDLYVPLISGATDHYHPDLFFRNLQNNTFSEEAGSRGIRDYDGGSHGGCWADLDNDGDYDLINATTIERYDSGTWVPGCNNVFRNNGEGYFTEVTPGSISDRKEVTRGLIAFDMDNDGDLDLYFVNGAYGSGDSTGERNEIYRNDGNFSFTAFTSGALYTCPAGQGCVDTDWDGDGDIDVITCNRDGDLNVLRNNGGFNNFTLVNPSSIGIIHRSYAGVTTGDIDSDGDLDLVMCNDTGNGVSEGYLYRNNGNGTFSHIRTFENADGYMAGFADLDNDGDLDLYMSGDDVVFLNDGSGEFSTGPSVPVSGIHDPRSHAFADIDNDGDMDFMIGVKRSRNYLIRNNNSNGNKYLKVRLIAPNGQAGAFGAKVRIYPAGQVGGTLLGMREAHSCHGYMGQDDPVLHFGLGSHSAVDVSVDFLNGTTVTRSSVPANSTILIDGFGHELSDQ